jgi:hypothetical protein
VYPSAHNHPAQGAKIKGLQLDELQALFLFQVMYRYETVSYINEIWESLIFKQNWDQENTR